MSATKEGQMAKCSTVGCKRDATHVLTYSFPGERSTDYQEDVCEPCGEGYVRRPTLKAMLTAKGQEPVAAEDVDDDGHRAW